MFEQLDLGRKLLAAAQPSIRSLDRITPRVFVMPELAVTRAASQLIAGHSSILAAREALLAQTRIQGVTQAWIRTQVEPLERIREMVGAAESVARLADRMSAAAVPFREIERAHSVTLQAWRWLSEAANADAAVAFPRLEAGTWVARETTLSVTELVPDFEERPVPWEAGPQDLRARLVGRLEELDPNLPSKLQGAWERIETPGPDAVGQTASSLVELIDWTLRLAAPDDEVLPWHEAENRPQNEFHNERPTRGLRARYALRARAVDGDIAEAFVSSLLRIQREIEGHKHKLGAKASVSLKHLIPAIEATLIFILLEE